jgi:hypothetical protein
MVGTLVFLAGSEEKEEGNGEKVDFTQFHVLVFSLKIWWAKVGKMRDW